jgi:hypothetical protein
MDQSEKSEFPRAELTAGRFVLRRPDRTESGLTADETAAILKSAEPGKIEVFRIHRVLADSGLELVGVSAESLTRQAAMMITFETVAEARRIFDGLIVTSGSKQPPCRVEMQLAKLDGEDRPFGIVLRYCEACDQPMAEWVRDCGLQDDLPRIAGPGSLAKIEGRVRQVILSETVGA